jgi:hypothetical protein
LGIAAGWRALAGRAASEQPVTKARKPTSGWVGFPRRRAAARARALAPGGHRSPETDPERGRFPGARPSTVAQGVPSKVEGRRRRGR